MLDPNELPGRPMNSDPMTADQENWHIAKQCFDQLKRLSSIERQQLKQLAIDDPSLLALVSVLLKHGESSNKSSQPSLRFESSLSAKQPSLQSGMRLGHYSLLNQLGQGGMGEVWLAQRDDGLYEGKAAIKILHPHYTNAALRDRFRREAHLLGRLIHPNIAQLLDAGITDATSGTTEFHDVVYLVLEYVPGMPIDVWCDGQQLSIRERVQLFIKLCEAVAHAHANLVVHRDLKPTNILVTESGQLKLLDFGIGKLVEQNQITQAPQLTQPSELTRVSGRIFTPEYAAPEQISGEGITTRTDVFVLGTLLYFLLCGTRPFRGVSSVAVEHAVLHAEPNPLTQAARNANPEVLAARSISAKQLQRELDGDLECIVTRALRKSPDQRYTSVAALIEDLKRFLDHQPVLARTGSRSYVVRRFVQRHRVGVAASAALLIAILAGLAGTLWNAKMSREQAQLAKIESNKATAVKQFLVNVFELNNGKQPDGAKARQTTAEEILNVASDKILKAPVQDFEVQQELLLTLGGINQNLGNFDQAETLYRQRLQLLRQHLPPTDELVFVAQLKLANSLITRDKFADSQAELDELLRVHRIAGIEDSATLGRAELILGRLTYAQADIGDARPVEHFRKAAQILKKYPAVEELRIQALNGLAAALELLPDNEQALAVGLQALEEGSRIYGSRSDLVAQSHRVVAQMYINLERLDQAEYHATQSIEIRNFASGIDALDTLESRAILAGVRLSQGRYRDAQQESAAILALSATRSGEEPIQIQYIRLALAKAELSIGNFEDALKALRSALSAPSTALDSYLLNLLNQQMAEVLLEQGKVADALIYSQRSIDQLGGNAIHDDNEKVAQALTIHAEVLTELGRFQEAQQSISHARQLKARLDRHSMFHRRLVEIRLAIKQKQHETAANQANQLIGESSNKSASQQYWAERETAYRYLATAQRALNKTPDSCQSLRAAIELRTQHALPTDPRLLQSKKLHQQCR
jgi:eukaryotic-like serine/threonine-protein kinase